MGARESVDGVLNICKPMGPTSHDIVNRVRRVYDQKRVGHAGTLDPMATGVLVVCLGRATRIVQYLTDSQKEYRATMVFGVRTDSEDSTGTIISESDSSEITAKAVGDTVQRYVGQIEQVAPMISAIKHQGKPLYKHAREGKTVERAPRRVTIYSIDLVDFRPGSHAEADLVVRCSSGTYIRTLCADIGDTLGCGAMMSRLERTRVGAFSLEQAVTLDELEAAPQSHVTPIAEALQDMPCTEVDSEGKSRILHGMEVVATDAAEAGSTVRIVSAGELIAIGIVGEDGTSVRPKKVLADPEVQAEG